VPDPDPPPPPPPPPAAKKAAAPVVAPVVEPAAPEEEYDVIGDYDEEEYDDEYDEEYDDDEYVQEPLTPATYEERMAEMRTLLAQKQTAELEAGIAEPTYDGWTHVSVPEGAQEESAPGWF